MRHVMLIAPILLVMAVAPAFGHAKKPKKPSAKPKSDQAFVIDAARGGMAEVELGRLAQQKAAGAQVKSFGKRMADDHTKVNEELQTLAKNKNITLPATLDPKHKAQVGRLSRLSGEAFDRAYLNTMVANHRNVAAEFKREAADGRDPDIKAFAQKTLSTIEDHLQLAQATSKIVGTSGRR